MSQGSAATHLMCGGQCNKYFVANLLLNSRVKKFENRLIFAKVIGNSIEVPFLTHSVVLEVLLGTETQPLISGHHSFQLH